MIRLIILSFLSLFSWNFSLKAATAPNKLPAIIKLDEAAVSHQELDTAVAKPGTLFRHINSISHVTLDPTRLIHIHPAGRGKVLAVMVSPGERVKKGEALLRYQNYTLHEAHIQETQLRAAITAARAACINARESLKRGKALLGQATSFGELLHRQEVLAQAEATLRTRQGELELLEYRFTSEFNSATETSLKDGKQADLQGEVSTLISPVDGIIRDIHSSMAGDLTPITEALTIADLSTLWIVSNIPPAQAVHIASGNKQVTQTPVGPLTSSIDIVDDVANPLTGLVRVISHIQNKQNALLPGMVLEATLAESGPVTGIIVPSEALQHIENQKIIFVQTDATHYHPLPVNVALDNGLEAVLQSGLKGGERVVSRGSFMLVSIVGLGKTNGE
ncbi:efflux RND transporter periplasmic adaptor subunit [Acetobacteraceae bacterium ESL0709]|nr:efflux RND transporter periplasmic adaptor subunit [Acetobacteraceae bacterium ESL0697]MDF7678786.1 efflux RND transporter periplasmic adaptor subunit [Acetobacteraceae bacterium ESL0709]